MYIFIIFFGGMKSAKARAFEWTFNTWPRPTQHADEVTGRPQSLVRQWVTERRNQREGGQKVGCQPTWRALIKPPSEWPTSSNQHQQLTERIRPWRRGTSVCLFFFFGLMDSCRDFKQVGYAITTPHQQMDKLLKESSPLHNQDRYTELNRFFSFHFLDQIYFWFSF